MLNLTFWYDQEMRSEGEGGRDDASSLTSESWFPPVFFLPSVGLSGKVDGGEDERKDYQFWTTLLAAS